MKKILFALLASVISLAAFSQVDSSQISISLKLKHHAYIVAFMPSRSDTASIRYMNQVAQKMSQSADTSQLIAVTVPCDLVRTFFLAIGSQQERLTAAYNSEIQAALFPQLFARPKLLGEIVGIKTANGDATEQLVDFGIKFLKAIRP